MLLRGRLLAGLARARVRWAGRWTSGNQINLCKPNWP
jgi:hypothetical protein